MSSRWFEQDALAVAPALLGARLRVSEGAGAVVVRLTEVEAYRGVDDPGSHAYRGPTRRNGAMFLPGGVLYVYLSYGMHHCVNVVCGPGGEAAAVLLRAGEVVDGIELARQRRTAARRDADLARGPARLAAALGLGLGDDRAPIAQGTRVSLLGLGAALESHRTGPRVGVSGAGGGPEFSWRFWLPGDPTVSSYRPARPRGAAVRGRTRPAGTAD